jgi:hypothetical protein
MNLKLVYLVCSVLLLFLVIQTEPFQFSQGYRGVIYPNTYVESKLTFDRAYDWANKINSQQADQSIRIREMKEQQHSDLDKNKAIWALQQQVDAYKAMLPYYSPEIIDETNREQSSQSIERFDIGLPIYLGGIK